MATSLKDMPYPELRNFDRFLSTLSSIPQNRIGYKQDNDDIVLYTELSFAQVHATLGNIGEAMRYLNKIKELLRST
mgnify:CR=1 FL=1